MSEIDRYKPEDRRGIEALTRRTLGTDAVEADRLTWDWRYRRNPVAADHASPWGGSEVVPRLPWGPDGGKADRLTWDWRYRRNPVAADHASPWVAREGPT